MGSALPAALAMWGGIVHFTGPIIPSILTLASTAWAGLFGWKLFLILRERLNYLLGFHGERFVGEILTPLIAHGFEVYHDVPFDGFNIDHVLVGPPGVFAVETKTRRKPFVSGKKAYRVEFDGSRLKWPWGPTTDELEQAENIGRTLSQWLGGAVGDRVWVTPILTLAGWLVDRTKPCSSVQVLNPKEITGFCRAKGEPLSENLIKRICFQLDQKCKLKIE